MHSISFKLIVLGETCMEIIISHILEVGVCEQNICSRIH